MLRQDFKIMILLSIFEHQRRKSAPCHLRESGRLCLRLRKPIKPETTLKEKCAENFRSFRKNLARFNSKVSQLRSRERRTKEDHKIKSGSDGALIRSRKEPKPFTITLQRKLRRLSFGLGFTSPTIHYLVICLASFRICFSVPTFTVIVDNPLYRLLFYNWERKRGFHHCCFCLAQTFLIWSLVSRLKSFEVQFAHRSIVLVYRLVMRKAIISIMF